jgi:penicillin-binding protein 2B
MVKKKTTTKTWNAPKYFLNVVFFTFLIITAQLAYITLFPSVYGINMDDFASARNSYSTKLYAKRGTIYDNDGNTLALNVSSYTVIAYLSDSRTGKNKTPLHVVDKEGTAKKLAPILNMSEEYILGLLNRDSYQVELGPGGRGITELVKEEIEDLNLPGIDFIETFKRYYPNGDFASYILGYAKQYTKEDEEGNSSLKIVGELGIESKYENILNGVDGSLTYQRDRYGYKIPDTKEDKIEAIDGSDIYLTLDSNIQRFVESAMEGVNEYSPEWASITVMNAKTGEILAASSTPSFNPNIRDITNYQNPFVSYAYEPGSTMKTFSYMCAVDSGKYDGNKIVKTGSVIIEDAEVRDWNRTGWGNITLDKGFIYSSNVATSSLVSGVITKGELRDCYDKFGFGQLTDIELAKEVKGTVNFNYPIEVATAAFGQGITTTILQQLQGMTIIANNGKLVKPHIVKKIVDVNNNELVYESKIQKSEQLVKTSTIEYMKNLLNEVVNGDDYNRTGKLYQMPGYDLIGKTGTAQIAGKNGYLQGYNDYIYSFSGMYPKDDPEIIIYAAIQRPAYGSNQGIARAVKEIITNTTKYLNLFEIESDKKSQDKIVLDSYKNKNTNQIVTKLQNNGINVIKLGEGSKIISQYPSKGTTLLPNDRMIIVTNDKTLILPDFQGWSKKEIIGFSKLLNINYKTEGDGFVKEQSVKAGNTIVEGMEINFTLENKNIEEAK